MRTHVILVHGIRVSDGGEGSIGRLADHFEALGCTTELFDYGRFGIFAPRWQNRGVAERLAERVADINHINHRVVVVAHSNGCAITHLAGEVFGASIDKVVYIAAALDRGVRFPRSFESFDVWHNPKDPVMLLARIPLWHVWGDMGRYGFTRFDHRGKNHNLLTNYDVSSGRSHSVFDADMLDVFGPLIAQQAVRR